MSVSLRIRVETACDAPAIESLTVAAFRDAPFTSHVEQHIIAALRRSGALALSLVAEADGDVVGHLALSPVSVSDGAAGWLGLGPVSVLPQYQRQGIGSQLVRQALDLARSDGASGCLVLGEPEFYGRFGFRADPGLVLPDVPPEYFLVLAFGSAQPRGTVTYHEAFHSSLR